MDEMKRGHGGVSGDEWYQLQASRAVNQVICHHDCTSSAVAVAIYRLKLLLRVVAHKWMSKSMSRPSVESSDIGKIMAQSFFAMQGNSYLDVLLGDPSTMACCDIAHKQPTKGSRHRIGSTSFPRG